LHITGGDGNIETKCPKWPQGALCMVDRWWWIGLNGQSQGENCEIIVFALCLDLQTMWWCNDNGRLGKVENLDKLQRSSRTNGKSSFLSIFSLMKMFGKFVGMCLAMGSPRHRTLSPKQR